jgi:xylulokinase
VDTYILAYDIGSTGCKTCLYRLNGRLELVSSALSEYRFITLDEGRVEQNPDDWWQAMAKGTRQVLSSTGLPAARISCISFCAQMQGLVLVDRSLTPLRAAMSYMDQRGGKQKAASVEHGLQVEGMNLVALLRTLRINGAAPVSVKDPIWKYLWVRDNEPDIFARVHKWLDVKDYLIARATGRCTMTRDSAFATFLTDERRQPSRWSPALLKLYGINPDHMPELIDSIDRAGVLGSKAARELGLESGIPLYGGGGDVSMITVGAGATRSGETYIYTGTSGWVSTAVSRRKVDVSRRIASIVGAQSGLYNYFGEQETAGKCLEWVRDHLALDEINLYLEKRPVTDGNESRYRSLYDFLIESIEQVPAGSGGVIFAPWLHGNRSPFEDPAARGIFFNLGLDTGKRMMIRAVVEGIIFHQKWLLESVAHGFPVRGPIRFVGGGALSEAVSRILADILELPVETIANPQNCGATGAALTAAIGLGVIEDFPQARECIPVENTFMPRREFCEVYRKQYGIFKDLYAANKPLFARMNSGAQK